MRVSHREPELRSTPHLRQPTRRCRLPDFHSLNVAIRDVRHVGVGISLLREERGNLTEQMHSQQREVHTTLIIVAKTTIGEGSDSIFHQWLRRKGNHEVQHIPCTNLDYSGTGWIPRCREWCEHLRSFHSMSLTRYFHRNPETGIYLTHRSIHHHALHPNSNKLSFRPSFHDARADESSGFS